jgi:hypothetical protein
MARMPPSPALTVIHLHPCTALPGQGHYLAGNIHACRARSACIPLPCSGVCFISSTHRLTTGKGNQTRAPPPLPPPPTTEVIPGIWLRVASSPCPSHHRAEGGPRLQGVEYVGKRTTENTLNALNLFVGRVEEGGEWRWGGGALCMAQVEGIQAGPYRVSRVDQGFDGGHDGQSSAHRSLIHVVHPVRLGCLFHPKVVLHWAAVQPLIRCHNMNALQMQCKGPGWQSTGERLPFTFVHTMQSNPPAPASGGKIVGQMSWQ